MKNLFSKTKMKTEKTPGVNITAEIKKCAPGVKTLQHASSTFFSLLLTACALLLTTFTALLLTTSTALAAAEVTVTVKNPDPYTGNQSWFVFTKNPGETVEDIATIKNFGDEPAMVDIYPVDAATSESGSFILKFTHDDQEGVGEWTTVANSPIEVKPGERIDVPFTINIPTELPPGQYIGGIVIEYGPSKPAGADLSCDAATCGQGVVSVKTRIGSRIYLNIPGKTEERIALKDFSYYTSIAGQPRFKFVIENNGNVTYQPMAEITIRDGSGKIYDSFTKQLGFSMPGTTVEPVVNWEKTRPLMANFTATAKVTFPKRFAIAGEPLHGAAMTKTVNFWIIPWGHIFYFTVFVVIAAMICFLHVMRVRKALANSVSYEVMEGEDIVSLAHKLNVRWKAIARLNGLKAPYTLRKGTMILIPKSKR